MKAFVIIFIALFLIQATFSKSLEEVNSSEEVREMRKNLTAAQKLILYIYENFLSITKHYSQGALKVCRQVLKDELIVSNTKPEMMEFKQNLTMFIEKFESNKKLNDIWDIMDIYTDTVDNYMDIPEDKETPESKIIVQVLEKYNYEDVITRLAKESETFMDGFSKLFEENKEHLEKRFLDWYDKFKNEEDMEKKIDTLMEFIDLE